MIFDTHAHYDSEQFNEDREELLCSMEEQGVGTIVNVCASYASCERVTNMVQKYPFMYAAVGIHPDHVGSLNEETFAKMKELFSRDKVIAVGEIGLDYYWDNESHDLQKKWFIRQLELARELDLPVLIHSRDAAADTMEIMKAHAEGLSGVIHCYSYSREMAQEYDISPKNAASILDTFSCIFQGIIPYGAQMLVAVSAATELGCEISAFDVMPNLYYPFMLFISSIIFIFLIPEKREK